MNRSGFKILYDTLKLVQMGKNTRSRLFYNQPINYNGLKPILSRLERHSLLVKRKATEEELRRDKRSRWFIELTDEGRRFIREVEVLNKRYSGILLEW